MTGRAPAASRSEPSANARRRSGSRQPFFGNGLVLAVGGAQVAEVGGTVPSFLLMAVASGGAAQFGGREIGMRQGRGAEPVQGGRERRDLAQDQQRR